MRGVQRVAGVTSCIDMALSMRCACTNTRRDPMRRGGTKAFPQGVFYAVHDDMRLGAFDWRGIATALSLREACAD